MNLFTEEQWRQLLENGSAANRDKDHPPVVKLFVPFTKCIWLLSEVDNENADLVFGLCDLGMGFPQLGYVSLSELASVDIPIGRGLKVTRDDQFMAAFPMSVYADAARWEQEITEDPVLLWQAANESNKKPLQPPRPS